MKKFPFITLPQSLLLLRVSTALIFLAHAVVRILLDGSVAQFATYLNNKGLVYGMTIVWLITVFEIIGGIGMALGYLTKWFAAGFIVLLLVGIVLIHAERGWFVGEHGSGGCEYSYILIIALVVIAAGDGRNRG
ncbi:MAG: DoxX family protein [Chitinophagaceae bacterium]|nr:DoxX family protein [Chitinophagaceae bacterium]